MPRVLRWAVLLPYAAFAVLPLAWLLLTSVKSRDASICPVVKFVPGAVETADGRVFAPSLEGWRRLGEPVPGRERSALGHFANSAVVAALSTAVTVALGTACAYGFSRFAVPGAQDWLFFVLSTRFLPPLAVVAPILLMFRALGLPNTHAGLILLYTAFNLSLAVWLMKGFLDEIPKAFEEAALVDGYPRARAFRLVILPQAVPGMAVTGVFCLIAAWNEFGFAMTLNNQAAVTVPVYFAGLQGNILGLPWPQVAAGALLSVAPIVLFTVLVRRHLLRGLTFGTLKQ